MAYQVFSKFTIIKFDENPSSSFQVVTCVQTDGVILKTFCRDTDMLNNMSSYSRERTVLLNVRMP
jgi:hypothetical protein